MSLVPMPAVELTRSPAHFGRIDRIDFGVVGPEHRRAADPRTPPIDGRGPKLTRDVVERIAIRLHDESTACPSSRRR